MRVDEFKPEAMQRRVALIKAALVCRMIQTVLLIILFTATANAQDYEIRFLRPVKIGDRFRINATGRNFEGIAVFAGQRLLQDKAEEIGVDLTATLTALEVDGSGKPSTYSVEIEKLIVVPNGVIAGILIPGAVVIGASNGPRFDFSVNGVPLDAWSSKALSIVVPTYHTAVTDDEVFGTRERKKIGESWPVDADIAARSLNETLKLNVDKNHLSGRSTLDGIVKQGSTEYLVIGANMRVDKFSMPLPNGITLQNGQLEGTFSGRFPVNPGRPPLSQSAKVSVRFSGTRAADPNTPELTLNGITERSVQREFQLLP